MRDFTCHQELQRLNRARIIRELDQALVNDLGTCLGSYVTPQIHIQLTGDFEVIGGPGITHRIMQCYTAPPADPLRRTLDYFSLLSAAPNSPFAPPNCSSSIFPNFGSGIPISMVYINVLIRWYMNAPPVAAFTLRPSGTRLYKGVKRGIAARHPQGIAAELLRFLCRGIRLCPYVSALPHA